MSGFSLSSEDMVNTGLSFLPLSNFSLGWSFCHIFSLTLLSKLSIWLTFSVLLCSLSFFDISSARVLVQSTFPAPVFTSIDPCISTNFISTVFLGEIFAASSDNCPWLEILDRISKPSPFVWNNLTYWFLLIFSNSSCACLWANKSLNNTELWSNPLSKTVFRTCLLWTRRHCTVSSQHRASLFLHCTNVSEYEKNDFACWSMNCFLFAVSFCDLELPALWLEQVSYFNVLSLVLSTNSEELKSVLGMVRSDAFCWQVSWKTWHAVFDLVFSVRNLSNWGSDLDISFCGLLIEVNWYPLNNFSPSIDIQLGLFLSWAFWETPETPFSRGGWLVLLFMLCVSWPEAKAPLLFSVDRSGVCVDASPLRTRPFDFCFIEFVSFLSSLYAVLFSVWVPEIDKN